MKGIGEQVLEQLDKRIALMLPLLNERQRRLYLAAEAITCDKSSVSMISTISGVSRNTITAGIKELQDYDEENESAALQEVRKRGAGRKKIHEEFPELNSKIRELICEQGTANQFFSWCGLSIRQFRELLKEKDYWIGRSTVAGLLQEMGYLYYDTPGNQEQLFKALQEARERGIPIIDLEVIGRIREHVPNRIWEFIKGWWKTEKALVVSSLPEEQVLAPAGIDYYSYPAGYMRWESRKICATIRPPEGGPDDDIRCMFWQIGE